MREVIRAIVLVISVAYLIPGSSWADGEPWVTGGTVTSGYCERERNGAQETHPGVDIAVYTGSGDNKKSTQASVKAGGAGTVVKVYKFDGTHYETDAPNSDWFKNFNMVVVKYADGTYAVFAHLSSISVNQGDSVTATTEIGKIGGFGANCANTFGNHLHLERRTDVNGDGTWGADEENVCATGSKDNSTNPIPAVVDENKKANVERSGGGGGLHQYTVSNSAESCVDCSIWYVRIDYEGVSPYVATAPPGWVASIYEEFPDWIEWIATDPSFEIPPGGMLAGFDYTSPDTPGLVNFAVDMDDAGSGSGISRTAPTQVMGVRVSQTIPTMSEFGITVFFVILLGSAVWFIVVRRKRGSVQG